MEKEQSLLIHIPPPPPPLSVWLMKSPSHRRQRSMKHRLFYRKWGGSKINISIYIYTQHYYHDGPHENVQRFRHHVNRTWGQQKISISRSERKSNPPRREVDLPCGQRTSAGPIKSLAGLVTSRASPTVQAGVYLVLLTIRHEGLRPFPSFVGPSLFSISASVVRGRGGRRRTLR
ncbi:hypothetical protein RRG08_030706 [Elysia crispata]|uniref:Uncharacterized protein n=1 Tax=Elysia crispata TaxID=231223 RepID=A0AAE1CSC5_9GAST|nr:hypothetical protein RRG08_030706 [Elysia crispata]